MRKLSVKKMSVLGLVLMAASATIAALVPSKRELRVPGKLVVTNTPNICEVQLTCVAGTGGAACNITASSTTQFGTSSPVQVSSGGRHTSDSPC